MRWDVLFFAMLLTIFQVGAEAAPDTSSQVCPEIFKDAVRVCELNANRYPNAEKNRILTLQKQLAQSQLRIRSASTCRVIKQYQETSEIFYSVLATQCRARASTCQSACSGDPSQSRYASHPFCKVEVAENQISQSHAVNAESIRNLLASNCGGSTANEPIEFEELNLVHCSGSAYQLSALLSQRNAENLRTITDAIQREIQKQTREKKRILVQLAELEVQRKKAELAMHSPAARVSPEAQSLSQKQYEIEVQRLNRATEDLLKTLSSVPE